MYIDWSCFFKVELCDRRVDREGEPSSASRVVGTGSVGLISGSVGEILEFTRVGAMEGAVECASVDV